MVDTRNLPTRVVELTANEVIKKKGECSLEEELRRFDLFRKNGINTADFLGYKGENNQYAGFQRIDGTHELPNIIDPFYNRGWIEGRMIALGYHHPFFSTSFDDTVMTHDCDIYLIDADEQREVTKNGIIVGAEILGKNGDFATRVLPSMNQKDLEEEIPQFMIKYYHVGYQDGLKKKIELDNSVPSQKEIYMKGHMTL